MRNAKCMADCSRSRLRREGKRNNGCPRAATPGSAWWRQFMGHTHNTDAHTGQTDAHGRRGRSQFGGPPRRPLAAARSPASVALAPGPTPTMPAPSGWRLIGANWRRTAEAAPAGSARARARLAVDALGELCANLLLPVQSSPSARHRNTAASDVCRARRARAGEREPARAVPGRHFLCAAR